MADAHPSESSPAPAGEPSSQVRALTLDAARLCFRGDVSRALTLVSDARRLAAASGRQALVAESVGALAHCRFCQGDYLSALDLFHQAARQYHDADHDAGSVKARASIGLCEQGMGEHEAAIESFLQAMDGVEVLQLKGFQARLHGALAVSYIALNQTADAEKHLTAGVAIADLSEDREALTGLILNESLLHRHRGESIVGKRYEEARREWQVALDLVDRALAAARAMEHRRDEARCLAESGTILSLLGHGAAARDMLALALDLGRDIGDNAVQAETLLALGRLGATFGNSTEAANQLRESAQIAERAGARGLAAEAHEALSDLAESEGDMQAALEHYKRFHVLREARFATTRAHAARASNLWREFQRATRQATELRERAATLAEERVMLERKADELAEVSEQDPLTGLLNRRALDKRIGAVVSASESEGLPMTVALIDVDHFKAINDRFSHGVGDAVLRRIADVVRDHCRVGDLPVRYGGDEFLVVLLGVGETDARMVLQRLKQAVDSWDWKREREGLAVTLSVGAASRAAGVSIADTIATADRALYAAKAAGRDCIVCDAGITAPARR